MDDEEYNRRIAAAFDGLRAALAALEQLRGGSGDPAPPLPPSVAPPDRVRPRKEAWIGHAALVVAVGGDGTLQAVLDSLAQAGGTPPHLAIVPCGTTNMTALDLGCGDSPTRMLASRSCFRSS